MARDITFRVDRFAGLRCDPAEDADRAPGASPDMLNFCVSPRGELIKRDGCELLCQGESALRGMWCGELGARTLYAAVFGNALYASDSGFDELAPVTGTVPGEEEVRFFPFMGALYLLTGVEILCFDGESLGSIEPYEPLLTTATSPRGDGTPVDDVNALTPRVKQSFVPDGTSCYYHLAVDDVGRVDRIERDGEEIPSNTWYWDDLTQAVVFVTAPRQGPRELVIHYRLIDFDEDLARHIRSCRCATAFGGANDTRVFLYGCGEAPAARFHSGMAQGSPHMGYFPVLNYTLIGDGSPVTGILRHYDRQLIFTEKSAYYSTLSYETETDGRLRAIFPVLPLSDDRGNLPLGQPLLVENEPCTVTDAGLFRWVSTNVRDERNARLFSQPVRDVLETFDPKSTRLFNRKSQGELFIVCGEDILVYRYGTGAFYRYRVAGIAIRFMAEQGGELYFGAGDLICRTGGEQDLGEPFEATWATPFLTLGAGDYEKNLFSVVLCADTSRSGAACGLQLITPEGEIPVRRTAVFSAGSRARVCSLPARHGHFERIQAKLTEAGAGKLRLRYLVFRGKRCDKHI